MDKHRVVGSAKKIKGSLKEVVGKAVGDAKLEVEGKADKIEGKVQNVRREPTMAASVVSCGVVRSEGTVPSDNCQTN